MRQISQLGTGAIVARLAGLGSVPDEPAAAWRGCSGWLPLARKAAPPSRCPRPPPLHRPGTAGLGVRGLRAQQIFQASPQLRRGHRPVKRATTASPRPGSSTKIIGRLRTGKRSTNAALRGSSGIDRQVDEAFGKRLQSGIGEHQVAHRQAGVTPRRPGIDEQQAMTLDGSPLRAAAKSSSIKAARSWVRRPPAPIAGPRRAPASVARDPGSGPTAPGKGEPAQPVPIVACALSVHCLASRIEACLTVHSRGSGSNKPAARPADPQPAHATSASEWAESRTTPPRSAADRVTFFAMRIGERLSALAISDIRAMSLRCQKAASTWAKESAICRPRPWSPKGPSPRSTRTRPSMPRRPASPICAKRWRRRSSATTASAMRPRAKC